MLETTASTPPSRKRRSRPGRKISAFAAIPDTGAANFLNAGLFAFQNGREATMFVTIQWALVKSPRTPSALGRRFKSRIGAWLLLHTGEPASWRQFREMGRWKGDHLHLLAWVPEHLQDAFDAEVERLIALDATTKEDGIVVLDPNAIRSLPVTPGDTLDDLASYGVKESRTCRRLGIVTVHHLGRAWGLAVPGQRISVSESLNRKARQDAGYVDKPLAFFIPPGPKVTPAANNVVQLVQPAPRPAPITTDRADIAA